MAKGNGRGGKRKGSGRKKKPTPQSLMSQMLVPIGPRVDHDQAEQVEADPVDAEAVFGKKPEYIDPVQFCLAVINNDVEVLSLVGILRPADMEERLIAARIASPFTNKKKPTETVNRFEVSWADEIRAAESRVDELRMDVRQNDRQSTETVN